MVDNGATLGLRALAVSVASTASVELNALEQFLVREHAARTEHD